MKKRTTKNDLEQLLGKIVDRYLEEQPELCGEGESLMHEAAALLGKEVPSSSDWFGAYLNVQLEYSQLVDFDDAVEELNDNIEVKKRGEGLVITIPHGLNYKITDHDLNQFS